MAADLLLALLRANITASAAALVVLAVRTPLRRWFGPGCAYAAWLMVPVAAAGSLMPVEVAAGPPGALEATTDSVLAWLSSAGHAQALAWIWLTGVAAGALVAAWRHIRFAAAIRRGCAGPAAVGVIQPRLVMPADIGQRFTDAELRLVQAHELAHIDRLDTRYNAAAAFVTWACWFNPLLHLAARAMRLDQELACDATVLDRMPAARRLYAETLLRTQQPAVDPLLGCQWRSRGVRPLEARIVMLARRAPSQARRDIGTAILLIAWAGAFCAAWTMQPPGRAITPAAPTMILIDLAAPSQVDARQDAEDYKLIEGSRPTP
jgi:beta-lactamase regulating signal transducer with metallopeptidase domain